MRFLRGWRGGAAVAVWVCVVAAGFTAMLRYESSPGLASDAPATWPADSALPRDARTPTLLVFLHPQCGCSRATVAELQRLLPHVRGAITTTIAFSLPPGAGPAFASTSLRDAAARVLGATVVDDPNETEAHRFHARTSGTTLLYDAHGRLRFAGGITGSRGHEGENIGEARLLALLDDRPTDRGESPVFGCGLDDPNGRPTP